MAFVWQVAACVAQSPAHSSQQSPPAGQSQSQSASQPQTQSQAPPQNTQDSVAEAARRAKAKNAAAARGKVFTEEDLSGMPKDGVSVVGTEEKAPPSRPPSAGKNGEEVPSAEEYWRGKAQPILQEMAGIDQQIAQLKEDIRKYGNGGFDIITGMKNNIAYVEDRNAQIQKLQKKKTNLQKQLDDLAEEGRKAGAEPAWFR